jgi:hypothetical protein
MKSISLGNSSSEIFCFFFVSLESSVSHFGGSIDEFKVDFFLSGSSNLRDQRLSQHNNFLLGSNATSLNHDEIVLDNSVVRESSDGSNLFISNILGGGGRIGQSTIRNSVNFFVHFSSMVITQLTGSGNSERNSGWMPSTNTSYFSKTSMGFLL